MELKTILRNYFPNILFIKKIFNKAKLRKIENHLLKEKDISNAFKSEKNKIKIICKCKKQWPKEYSKVQYAIDKELKKRYVEDKKRIINDIIFYYFGYGFSPEEYFLFELFDKSHKQRLEFVSDKQRDIIVYSLNDIIDMDIFLNKWKTYCIYRQFYFRDACYVSSDNRDYDRFIEFVQKYPRFVEKKINLSRGESVRLVIKDKDFDESAYFNQLVGNGPYILEELIIQSNYLSKLNASSVNTVRCITFNVNGDINIPYCFIKIGQNNAFVDNGGAGGILVGIDIQSGKLNTDGIDELGNIYEYHPNSMIKLLGYQLPDWGQCIELAKILSKKTKTIKYIGWDLAHTDNGWIIVEGNGSGQFIGPQLVYHQGIAPDLRKLLKGEHIKWLK